MSNAMVRALDSLNSQPIERDDFFRSILRELSGTLEDVVGLDEAIGFISMVGASLGDQINQNYKAALDTQRLSLDDMVAVLVDLKKRIGGDFYLISMDEERIVLGNRFCPFGEKVADRPSLCMMTSNVFGRIAAQNSGYARVALDETIARGDGRCIVTIDLKPGTDGTQSAPGREYFAVDE